MGKHTKGQWFADGLEVVTVPAQIKVAKVSGATREEALANVRLISYANVMFDILSDIANRTTHRGQLTLDVEELSSIYAVVSKAGAP